MVNKEKILTGNYIFDEAHMANTGYVLEFTSQKKTQMRG